MAVEHVEITVGGESMQYYLIRNSVRIVEKLENRAGLMTFTVEAGYRMEQDNVARPVAGMQVGFMDRFTVDGDEVEIQMFTGFVTRVEPRKETGVGGQILLDIEATDLTYILVNHAATETFQNQTLFYIVDYLVQTYAGNYGIDTSQVDTGPTIETVQFNHLNLRRCFERLADLTGYEWWLDFYNVLHFKPKGYTSSPEDFTDDSGNYYALSVDVDGTQVRNSITIEGGVTLSSAPQVDVLVGNGQSRSFPLTYKPKDMVSIEVDDGGGYDVMTYGVDPVDNEVETGTPGTYQFMFNFQEKFVRNAAGGHATLVDGYKLRVTYNYETPVITEVQSEDSIAAMVEIEGGGDGIHAYHIKEDNITSLEEAILRAQREIDEYGFPLYDIRIRTHSGLLQEGSFFHPGQLCTVTFPSWKIDTAAQFIIQEVVTTFQDDGESMYYDYQIRLGGRKITASWLLDRMLAKQDPIDETVEQRKVKSVKEKVGVSETITRDNGRTVSETTGAGETIVATITTPPYRWGESPASSKPGKYGLAVWAS